MRFLVWLFRAFVFFTLFAFALNNRDPVTVRWFFGLESHAPMVIVVLAAFAAGCAIGVLAMVPAWWRHRRLAKRQAPPAPTATPAAAAPPTSIQPSGFGLEHPPRDAV
ncbi:MAG: LapA family protein [Burkholderiales bacterium]|nr:LapA family protein [Burkholderiales bacterium]